MVNVREDLTGQHIDGTFLTVIRQVEDYVSPKGNHKAQWLCLCDCGNECIVIGSDIKRLHTISCGCSARKENQYDLSGEYGIGWTYNTNQEFYFNLEDFNLIKDYCWYEDVGQNGYHSLKAKINSKNIKMCWLFGCKGYDHIDRNPLNNRRENLRPATYSQNSQNSPRRHNNTSGIIGVNWHKHRQKWVARININCQRIIIGYYVNKEDAIIARLKAENEYYGKFSPQIHLFEQYGITQQNN